MADGGTNEDFEIPQDDGDASSSYPHDKVLCEKRFYRYVVACMHNCPHPHFCEGFWSFFAERNMTPPAYYNEGGIGDEAMRRIVIDCDRCGKRDVPEVFALYAPEGEGEEYRLAEEAHRERVAEAGYSNDEVWPLVVEMMKHLEGGKDWVHFCKTCFQKVCDSAGAVLNIKRVKKKAPAKPEKQEAPVEPKVETAETTYEPLEEDTAPDDQQPVQTELIERRKRPTRRKRRKAS